ncbi:putative odorant receptor 85d [Tribolium madens]|uniref:putative odorant receptor 85d n=1 Tax=Tribolium madens TaxID=41895 RepID=UPI001CF74892|nr:putative odorant receptor 85d [Tribolium madens]
MIFPCIAAIIGQQFKILASNLKNNIFYALLKCGIPRHVVNDFKNNFDRLEPNETIMSVIKRNQFRKANLIYLKKNIAHHQILLNYCDDLNRIIGFFLFVKIIAAFCNIIFIMFTLITSGAQTEIMSLCFYVFFASTELFVYTYGGQILIEKSEFLWDLYDSPWYLCEVKFQKLMLMVQMKVQRVVYMRAGGYFAMCAPMFITFMKSLMSYIALLRELVVSDKSNS